ncbi:MULTISPECIES: JAB domain-containing protein [unclassified Sphingobacterium]|uniref:JAB domain-containing protein n=1 Tax=unclassified Sphingobacterium TaxID=2609468 RepID=UPI0028B1629A|nr:JAB domain-containing protein [Sphingobacterium sp.]
METQQNQQEWQQVAEVRISYQNPVRPSQRPKLTSSKEVYSLLLTCWNAERIEYAEEFKILLLNTGNRVLGIYQVSAGGIDATPVDAKVIFTAALKANASALILVHNHPSGNLVPSDPDILLTKKIDQAARLLDIRVLDHLIITPDGYYSFKDSGRL